MCHTTACEQREGKAQGTECVREAQRETTMSCIYFRTEALRVQCSAHEWIFFFHSRKHSNFGLKQDDRKSQSLTTAEALHTSISRTHASSGHPSSGGQPWTVTKRLGLSPELPLGELGWKRDGARVTQLWGHLGANTILDSTWLNISLS